MRVIKMITLCLCLGWGPVSVLPAASPPAPAKQFKNVDAEGIEEERLETERLKNYYRGVAVNPSDPISPNPVPLAVGAAELYAKERAQPSQSKEAYVDAQNNYIREANRELDEGGNVGKCYKYVGGSLQEIACVHEQINQGPGQYVGTRYDRDLKTLDGQTGEKTWRDGGDNPQNRPKIGP